MLKIAAAQYDVRHYAHWREFEDDLSRRVADAAQSGAQLLVFPEYGSMELVSLFEPSVQRDLAAQLDAMQPLFEDYQALYQRLATDHDVWILAASFPLRSAAGAFRNRALLFSATAAAGYQDKLLLTPFERQQWLIEPGTRLDVLPGPAGPLGVNVCYDSEFPLLARHQVERGARLILVPSCTDTLAGYHRVRIACRARAMENQCCVVHAATVGRAPWSPSIDINVGAAGIFTPVDGGFADDGILAEGEPGRGQWVFGEVDFAAIDAVRSEGRVRNFADWSRQADFVGGAD